MRARLGILLAKQSVLLRDIVMKNIPSEMLAVSPKGTVPVRVLNDLSVIDESLDIMLWELNENDPNNLLYAHQPEAYSIIIELVKRNDTEFVEVLNKYKAAARYHDVDEASCRQQCESYITDLERCLNEHDFLIGATSSFADYAILPFIRQFSRVDRKWFVQAPYPKLQRWLEWHYQYPVFAKAMTKYPQWLDTSEDILFGSES